MRSLSDSLGALKLTVWVEHKLLGRTLVEVLVALRSLIERDDRGVDGPGDLGPVVEDRHHQLPVVLHDRALAGVEGVALGPAEPDADLERPLLGLGVRGARVAGDVQARYAHSAAGARDVHGGVEDRRRSLHCVGSVPARLEAYGVHRAVDLGLAEYLGDLLLKRCLHTDVDRLAAERTRLLQTLILQITHDHNRGPEDLGRVGSRKAHRTRARYVDRRASPYARRVAAVVAGGEDVREHGEVQDLLHRLVAIGELEQVEVREGDHHVAGLPADPAAHVHVAVSRARASGIDVQAHAGLALLAVPAAPAGDVERHRADVADVYELDVVALLDDLARDLVSERLSGRSRRPSPDHMLVGAADVGRDDP